MEGAGTEVELAAIVFPVSNITLNLSEITGNVHGQSNGLSVEPY